MMTRTALLHAGFTEAAIDANNRFRPAREFNRLSMDLHCEQWEVTMRMSWDDLPTALYGREFYQDEDPTGVREAEKMAHTIPV